MLLLGIDTAGLIIEVIWANFSVSPSAKIITLRVFLQETLRRSRTSYSTLQTALFYLFRIKSIIAALSSSSSCPRHSSSNNTTITNDGFPPTPTSEYPPDLSQRNNTTSTSNQNNDPATCGRRMFLAALIVASKYLQDRNYSNRAWSKISGLPVNEINANEICFLKLINYNLFIAEDIFKRWSSLLLTHIQAISGSEISSPDAFRRLENQREVSRFREILKSLDPQTMDCKRPTPATITFNHIYPNTPAASAPGSPRIMKPFMHDNNSSTLSFSPLRALDTLNNKLNISNSNHSHSISDDNKCDSGIITGNSKFKFNLNFNNFSNQLPRRDSDEQSNLGFCYKYGIGTSEDSQQQQQLNQQQQHYHLIATRG